MVRIYALIDPRTQEVRYVGKTTQTLAGRYRCHLSHSRHQYKRTENFHSYRWIRSLLALHLKPAIRLLEETTDGEWAEREKYWIAQFDNLTNLTPGGEGAHGYHQTPIHRRRIGDANRGDHNGQAKITEVVAQQMKILATTGDLNYQDIADIFGVSPALVGLIRRGQRWSHLPTV